MLQLTVTAHHPAGWETSTALLQSSIAAATVATAASAQLGADWTVTARIVSELQALGWDRVDKVDASLQRLEVREGGRCRICTLWPKNSLRDFSRFLSVLLCAHCEIYLLHTQS